MAIASEFIIHLKGKPMHRESALIVEPFDRLMCYVEFAENGCWEWAAAQRFPNGYGRLRFGRRSPSDYAHVWSYWLHKGPIPEGLEIDHLCRNRCCINPDHLEAVTHQVNSIRADAGVKTGQRNRAKTHCRNGHEFTPENTYRNPQGERACRVCQRIGAMKYYWKQRGQVR